MLKSIWIGSPLSKNQFMKVKKPRGNKNEKNILVPVLLLSRSILSFARIPGIPIFSAQVYFSLYSLKRFLYPIMLILITLLCSLMFNVAMSDKRIGTIIPNANCFISLLRYQSSVPVISSPLNNIA